MKVAAIGLTTATCVALLAGGSSGAEYLKLVDFAKAGCFGVVGEPPPGKTAVDWQGLKAAFAADRPEWFVIEPVTSDRFDTISRSIDNLEGMEIV